MALARCACGSFLPARAEACPHCRADVVRPGRLRLVCGVLGGSTIAFTLMACYGAAPHRGGATLDADQAPDAQALPDSGR